MMKARFARQLLLGLVSLAVCAPAAAERCQPRTALPLERPLELHAADVDTAAWLEGRLQHPLTVPRAPAAFGIRAGETSVIDRDVQISGVVIGHGVVQGDRAVLKTEYQAGTLLMRSGTRKYSVSVVDHQARELGGSVLPLSPSLEGDGGFEVVKDGSVTGVGPNEVRVEAGTLLRWRPQADRPLRMYLLAASRLAETMPSEAGISGELAPERAPVGGKLTFQLNAAGLDLRTHQPIICFSGKQVQQAEPARFVSNGANDSAIYEVRLSKEIVDKLVEGSSWWERIRGVKVDAHALAFVDNQPMMDLRMPLHITSARWSALVGFVVLFVLYVICALLMREPNLLRMIGVFIEHRSGRFSLSNLQVLLWSLLVIFAFTFSWVSTGQLISLSPSVLGLLAIAGASNIAARSVERMKTPATDATPPEKVEPKKENFVRDSNENFDLLRFQMLGFTLFSLAYSLWSVLKSDGLPDLPESLYWLMGGSNLAYVGGKATDKPTGSAASTVQEHANPAEQALPAERIKALQKALVIAQTGTIDSETREAVTRYKQRQGLYPVNGRITEPLMNRLGV